MAEKITITLVLLNPADLVYYDSLNRYDYAEQICNDIASMIEIDYQSNSYEVYHDVPNPADDPDFGKSRGELEG